MEDNVEERDGGSCVGLGLCGSCIIAGGDGCGAVWWLWLLLCWLVLVVVGFASVCPYVLSLVPAAVVALAVALALAVAVLQFNK